MQTSPLSIFRFALLALIGLVLSPLAMAHALSPPADSVHFCLPFDYEQWERDHPLPAAKRLADRNVGEPRTVRMIYFLPNDRPYRAEVVQKIKDTILNVQTFYAEQMQAHGYGNKTFRIETDAQGDPLVHRVNGQHSDSHYLSGIDAEAIQMFDNHENIYLIVVDNSQGSIGSALGVGFRNGKNGGEAWVSGSMDFELVAHELGHAFGLEHDFSDGVYIMSYGPGQDRLSACAAEFLAVHPYFNPDSPIEEIQPPTIELISPRDYPAGSERVSIQLKVGDSEGLHQVFLFSTTPFLRTLEVKACRGLAGEKDTVVEFKYDGMIPSVVGTSLSNPTAHEMSVEVVDTDGNVREERVGLAEISPYRIAKLEGHADEVLSVSFSSDGTMLASGADDGTVILWDVRTQKRIATLDGHTNSVFSLSFSSDGTLLASGSSGTVILWDVRTQKRIATLDGHTNSVRSEGGSISTLHWVRSLSFSPDGTLLASGADDGTVILWDVRTRKRIATLAHADEVNSVSFSPDGTLLASGANDGTVILWDVRSQDRIATLDGHTSSVRFLSFSSDGTLLASGGPDGTVILWDVRSRERIADFAHTDWVYSVSLSSDGTMLASAGEDNMVRLWDVLARQEIATFAHTYWVYSVSFSSDGTMLASGSKDHMVVLWDMSAIGRATADSDGERDDDDGILAFDFAGAVEDQTYTAGTAITVLEMPEAVGGEGEVTYRVFGLPAGLTFDAATRTISGTPEAATDGAVEVTYEVVDSAGNAVSVPFSITVNPPLSDGDGDGRATADSDGERDDDDGILAFDFVGAVEDQTYTAGTAITVLELPEAVGGEGEVTYRVFGLPAGLTFDAATRTISGTPEATTDGAVAVIYGANDSAGNAALLPFSITVNPPLSLGDFFDLVGVSDGSFPHHQYCEDGVGQRDVDFTCDGYRNMPDAPSPDQIRLKVEGNEEYLRQRFEDAFEIEVLSVVSGESYTSPPSHETTFNLSDGTDDFFRFEIEHRAHYFVQSVGAADTWGDLYLDEQDSIRPIAGTGTWADRGNFAFQRILDPGTYYLRVSPETDGETGTYTISVVTFIE